MLHPKTGLDWRYTGMMCGTVDTVELEGGYLLECCFPEIKIKGWRQLRAKTWKYNDFLGVIRFLMVLLM
jgi:hypothetical protein